MAIFGERANRSIRPGWNKRGKLLSSHFSADIRSHSILHATILQHAGRCGCLLLCCFAQKGGRAGCGG
eukprot:COSAG01_NODE_5670_length_4108_cov_15.236219_6_plen_68_part_00